MITIGCQLGVTRVANGYVIVPNLDGTEPHVVLASSREAALKVLDVILGEMKPRPARPTPEYARLLEDVAASLHVDPERLRKAVAEGHWHVPEWGPWGP